MPKVRLDLLLVERGLAENTTQAERLVMAGQVRVGGQVELKPSTQVSSEAVLEVIPKPRYVSRGGEKMEAALQAFQLDLADLVCADVGSSTGGFTDCLLQHGAARIYAIDVGHGILDWKLRQDERVVVVEDTNARHLKHLPELISLVTIDASFISLKTLLPVVKGWLPPTSGQVIALIKPQFEAAKVEAARAKGVIRDPAIHQRVLLDILAFAQGTGYQVLGLIRSPLSGPKGNTEFLTWLGYPAQTQSDIALLIDRCLK